MSYFEKFKVKPGSKVKLKKIDPSFSGGHKGAKSAADEIEHYQEKLRELQDLLYAERRHSLLICLQALDTGGKDGAINHVLGAMTPQGCRVAPFKQPPPKRRPTTFCGARTYPRQPAAKSSSSIVLTTKTSLSFAFIISSPKKSGPAATI